MPGPGDPDGTGSAKITLNEGRGQVCWDITVAGITLPAAAAHIHEGVVGQAGDIVVTLSPPGANGKSSGCRSGVNRALIKDITENQQNYYVNVHTSDFPAGAVRGQLWVPGQARHVQDAIPVQFLNVSDWHAQLDPLDIFGVGFVGGAAQISSYWKADRAAEPNTLTLTAGDAYGAAPALSSFFRERTAVMAMNLMGFDVDTFGNHNFDRGIAHLQEMIDLAEFQYVSANLENVEDNLTGVKPFEIFDMNGAKVAVVGLTNPEAPELVFPGSFGTIEVTDPVAAAMDAKAEAEAAGADVVVAITHMGVTGHDTAGEEVGPLIDFAEAVSGFDVIFGDHTDFLFSDTINGQLVLENRSKGVTYARTHLTLDPNTGTVFNHRTEFVTPLSSAVTPDQAIVDMLAPFRIELAAIFDERIAGATAVFPRGGNIERRQEVAIGNFDHRRHAARVWNATRVHERRRDPRGASVELCAARDGLSPDGLRAGDSLRHPDRRRLHGAAVRELGRHPLGHGRAAMGDAGERRQPHPGGRNRGGWALPTDLGLPLHLRLLRARGLARPVGRARRRHADPA